MDFKDPNGLSRIVQSLTVSVDDAERFHPPEAALQTKQYLATIRAHLRHTLRWHLASQLQLQPAKPFLSHLDKHRAQRTAYRSTRLPMGMQQSHIARFAAYGPHAFWHDQRTSPPIMSAP